MIWIATSPEAIPGEVSHINSLLYAGLDVLLLRKPGFSAAQYEQLLQGIDPLFFSKIMIAGQPALVEKYGLRGLHLSEALRASIVPEDYKDKGWQLSTSIHTEQIETWSFQPAERHAVFAEVQHMLPSFKMWQHLVLGPVFNSISKPGYTGRLQEMKNIPANALAIGGITQYNIGRLKPMGFCGAVLLGAIWNDPFNAVPTYQSIHTAWNRT
jgi:Thiamine monophosphate synthase